MASQENAGAFHPGFHSAVAFEADGSGKVTKLTVAELGDVDGGDLKEAGQGLQLA